MMDLAATEVIKGILEWLHGDDESQWYDETKLLAGTVAKLREMARAVRRSGGAEPHVISTQAMRINTALPHLYKMTAAMQRRNRTAAIVFGKLAVEALSKIP